MTTLGDFPNKLDYFLHLHPDRPEDRADSFAAGALPVMRAVAKELRERWERVHEHVGNTDGLLLAAATIEDLADELIREFDLTECLYGKAPSRAEMDERIRQELNA